MNRLLGTLVLSAGLMTATARATVIISDSFGSGTGGLFPSTAQAGFDYWYAPDTTRTWNWSTTGQLARTNFTSGTSWLLRNVATGNQAPAQITNPSLAAEVSMQYGGNTDSKLKYYFGLFNSTGNGYIAEVVRNGTMNLYRVDNGYTGTWTLLGGNTSNTAGNQQTITFSITSGTLLVQSSLGGSLTATDNTYTSFSLIGFASAFPAGEQVRVYSADLSGTVVPEAASLSLLLIPAIGLLTVRK